MPPFVHVQESLAAEQAMGRLLGFSASLATYAPPPLILLSLLNECEAGWGEDSAELALQKMRDSMELGVAYSSTDAVPASPAGARFLGSGVDVGPGFE